MTTESKALAERVEFSAWLKELDAVAIEYGDTNPSYTSTTGSECWLGYFEDGYTPEEAYREDCSNGY